MDIPNNLYTTVTSNTHIDSPAFKYPNMGEYVSAAYDRKWYIGHVIDISMAENYCNINFMVTNGPSDKPTFRWPAR